MRGKLEYNTTPIFKYALEFMRDFNATACDDESRLYFTHLRKYLLPESALSKVKARITMKLKLSLRVTLAQSHVKPRE